MSDRAGAARVLERCADLDLVSARPGVLERTHLTPEHARANRAVAGWLEAAGATSTWQDAAGNQWGRREGRRPGLPALVLGSHVDTVPDAGSFDGMLGVLMAVEVLERLGDRVDGLPFALEVVAFSDEEGTRFGSALLGSKAVAGLWDEADWDLRDRDGTTLHQAFLDFGLDPRAVGDAARDPASMVGYLEAHIEQGPYLEAAGASLGNVTSIAGARRFRLVFTGEARHAGGTPYPRRRDALVGASEAIVAIERVARERDCIATVGRIEVSPGAVNVIPGRAAISLDLRAEADDERDATWAELERVLGEICGRRNLELDVVEAHRADSAPCAPWLQRAVTAGIRATGDDAPMDLWSRAGHDAMVMASVADIGMLFVRCADGISHHPDEDVRAVDVEAGLLALERAVLEVAAAVEGRT